VNRSSVDWHGFWPASPTPFTESRALDEDAFRRLLRLYAEQGMHGILINGTTGEWFSQTDEERQRVAEIAVAELKGKMTVVIGVTTFTPAHSIALAKHAMAAGADGILSTPPPYAVPNPDEVVAFYQAISDGVDAPLMVYNWPRGTNVEITPDVATRLAAVPNVVAIKNSTGNKALFFETLEAVVDKIRVFGGFMSPIGIHAYKTVGGDGTIGGGALLGREYPEFYEALDRNDLARAREIAAKSAKLSSQLGNPDFSGKYGSPQAWLKAAMNLLGQPGGYPRPPLLPVDDPAKVAKIREALGSVGLLKEAAVAAV
jgi:1-pyrroline-4-hydroxy-2-carboxylate deaminase